MPGFSSGGHWERVPRGSRVGNAVGCGCVESATLWGAAASSRQRCGLRLRRVGNAVGCVDLATLWAASASAARVVASSSGLRAARMKENLVWRAGAGGCGSSSIVMGRAGTGCVSWVRLRVAGAGSSAGELLSHEEERGSSEGSSRGPNPAGPLTSSLLPGPSQLPPPLDARSSTPAQRPAHFPRPALRPPLLPRSDAGDGGRQG